ncbi:MAG: GNAT family N-acetyltransferase [Dehalococcoidia bacterium]
MAATVNIDDLPLPLSGERFRIEREGEGIAISRIDDGSKVGSIALEAIDQGLFIYSLCVDEAHRSYGAGSEAARLLNEACEASRVTVVRAWAAPNLRLSVYFWIRMGFRPLHGEGPDGGIWFERRAGSN